MIDLLHFSDWVEFLVKDTGGRLKRVEELPSGQGTLELSSKRYNPSKSEHLDECCAQAVSAVIDYFQKYDYGDKDWLWTGLRLELRVRGPELHITCFTRLREAATSNNDNSKEETAT